MLVAFDSDFNVMKMFVDDLQLCVRRSSKIKSETCRSIDYFLIIIQNTEIYGPWKIAVHAAFWLAHLLDIKPRPSKILSEISCTDDGRNSTFYKSFNCNNSNLDRCVVLRLVWCQNFDVLLYDNKTENWKKTRCPRLYIPAYGDGSGAHQNEKLKDAKMDVMSGILCPPGRKKTSGPTNVQQMVGKTEMKLKSKPEQGRWKL